MRPVRLEMSAFGSYGGVEVIDFDRNSNGLFLIAGDTGSGKSTIFDAIMFALFDTMSGKERKSSMMRSEYAKEDCETYVEYTFEYGSNGKQDTYTIKRYPPYDRRSKRKNKSGEYSMIRQGAKVSLIMSDGTEYPGKIADINEKIRSIIGLTADQFSRIVMIAQGEFQELIMDRTGNRKEIFRQIFSTQIYEDIEKKIYEKFKEVQSSMLKNATQLGELIKSADIPENSPFYDEWNEAFVHKDTEPDAIINVLDGEIKRVNAIYTDNKKIYDDYEKQFNKISKEIAVAREQNSIIDELKKLSEKLNFLNEKKKDIESDRNKLEISKKAKEISYTEKIYTGRCKEKSSLEERKKALIYDEKMGIEELGKIDNEYDSIKKEYDEKVPIYKKQKDELERELKNYNIYADKYKSFILKKKKADDAAEKLAILKEKEKLLLNEKKSYEVKINEAEGIEVQYEQVIQKLKDADRYNENLSELSERNNLYKKLEGDAEKIQAKLLTVLKEWEEQRHKYEEYSRLYISAQSSFLARKLKDDEPCPVCGSLTHPHPAVGAENIVTKEMLEEEKKLEKKKEKNKSSYQKKADEALSKAAAAKAVLEQSIDNIFENEELTDSLDIILPEKKEAAEKRRKELLKVSSDIKKKISEKSTNKEKYQKVSAEHEEILKEIEKTTQYNHTFELEVEGDEKELKLIKDELKYGSAEEAEKAINLCVSKYTEIEKQYSDIEKRRQLVRDKITKVKSVLSEVTESLKKTEKAAEEALADFNEMMIKEGFVDTEEYHNALLSDETIKKYEENIAKYDNDYIKTDTKVQTLKNQVNDKKYIDTEEMQSRCDIIDEEMAKLKEVIENLTFTIHTNKKCNDRIKELMRSRGSMNERMRVIKSLNDTANGKIHFQTYIQRQYFKQIIQAANKRLVKMTTGEFLLKCREIGRSGQGEMGLELDVYNPVTGRVRDSRTLSGGETFMASLSMALGMADIVQNTVGKTKLDTMFIDEGFGSLSDEVRDKAVKVLIQLAGDNRLVGVISHVSELKEQIPHRLLVTKGSHGSHVRWAE